MHMISGSSLRVPSVHLLFCYHINSIMDEFLEKAGKYLEVLHKYKTKLPRYNFD